MQYTVERVSRHLPELTSLANAVGLKSDRMLKYGRCVTEGMSFVTLDSVMYAKYSSVEHGK